jgi:hypothetical protein
MWSNRTRRYTRCRLHGGASTGPTTPEGLEKCRRANWKDGNRSAEAIAERRAFRFDLRMLILETKQLEKEIRVWLRELGATQPQMLLSANPYIDTNRNR